MARRRIPGRVRAQVAAPSADLTSTRPGSEILGVGPTSLIRRGTRSLPGFIRRVPVWTEENFSPQPRHLECPQRPRGRWCRRQNFIAAFADPLFRFRLHLLPTSGWTSRAFGGSSGALDHEIRTISRLEAGYALHQTPFGPQPYLIGRGCFHSLSQNPQSSIRPPL
jgi:hypothetical protein